MAFKKKALLKVGSFKVEKGKNMALNFEYAVYSTKTILVSKRLYVRMKAQLSPISDDGLSKKRPTVH